MQYFNQEGSRYKRDADGTLPWELAFDVMTDDGIVTSLRMEKDPLRTDQPTVNMVVGGKMVPIEVQHAEVRLSIFKCKCTAILLVVK